MDSSKKHINVNPKATANPVSRLLFWWIIDLFRKGRKRDLGVEDLYNVLPVDQSSALCDRLERNWLGEVRQAADGSGRPASLLRALVKTFGWEYAMLGFFTGFHAIVLKVSQPLLLGLLLQHFEADAQTSAAHARWCAAAMLGCAFLGMFFSHHITLTARAIGMRVRLAVCSLLYRKVLTSSQTALGSHGAGALANLLSNDAARFDTVLMFLHYTWILPIQTAIVTYIVYHMVGGAALIGVASLFLQTVPVQSFLSRLASRYRTLIASRTDARVRVMSEILSGMQAIKMYAWEKPFEKLVALTRRREMSVVTKSAHLKAIYMSFMVFSERTSLYVTLVSCVLLDIPVTPAKVFALAQFFNVLQLTMAIFYPEAVLQGAETKVSISRLQAVLELKEHVPLEDAVHPGPGNNKGVVPGNVWLLNALACWRHDTITPTLSRVNMAVKPGQLCALVGAVGAGKSSLLLALLGELPLSAGAMSVGGRVSYASQEPWLFAGTVRANILFGAPWDAHRYRRVVRACALEPDLEALPHGDHSLVGEKGAGLSGGQRARVSLARAVYRDADVYLLDDPLSAVDAHVGRHLFDNCVTGLLRGKTVVMATHQLHFLHTADLIVILNNGKVENQGTYNELQLAATSFATALTSEDDDAAPKKPKRASRRFSETSARSSACGKNSDADSDDADSDDADDDAAPLAQAQGEVVSHGDMRWALYADYFHAGASWPALLGLMLLLIVAQAASSGADYWVTFWTNQEEQRRHMTASTLDLAVNGTTLEHRLLKDVTESFTEAVETTTTLINMTFTEIAQNLTTNLDLEMASSEDLLPTSTCLWVYSGFILGSVLLTSARSFWFMGVCMRASRRLHDAMFASVVRATMLFFDTNPSGRVLNRFSKDMGAVDEILPKAFLESIQVFLVMTGILTMVVIVTPWFLCAIFVVGFFFWQLRVVYLASAQDLKRLDGVTRSPVISHVTATLDGLATARACHAQSLLRTELDTLQDSHTASWDLVVTASAAFGLWLDLLSTSFVAMVTLTFLLMPQGSMPGALIGLAISQSLILTGMLQHGIRGTAEVVAQMTSVERLADYTALEREAPFIAEPGAAPARDWPLNGEIRFERVTLTYAPGAPPSLRDLDFVIKAGHKVGVVGRTGAGKSSLVAALFRLAPTDGTVRLDDLDTAHVGLTALRTRLSIIPQTPALFAGSLRYNLDPTGSRPDHALWTAVREVELHQALPSLDAEILEGGANLSAGQRQLVCLARAIVRDNRVLVLDEATANVDPQTDQLIQSTIRECFFDCTVITIAHRLITVMDSDRLLVMDAGAVAEYDAPHLLLQLPDSALSRMVAETGTTMSQRLRDLAKQTFERHLGSNEDAKSG